MGSAYKAGINTIGGTTGASVSTSRAKRCFVAVAAALVIGCAEHASNSKERNRARNTEDTPWFEDLAASSGIQFEHTTGKSGQYLPPEIIGSGCGLLDYDGDGDLDAYLIQAYDLTGDRPEGSNRLFRNQLEEIGSLKFEDVTDQAGLGDTGYGMGCAAGDIDNDGDVDLYVTNFGDNALYRNNGDGSFTASADAVPAEPRWSTSAAFLDYDNDGWLDLFVTNYINFSMREIKVCHRKSGAREYCGPQAYDAVSDRLFHNRGEGTFEDVTAAAGIDVAYGSGLGVVCADFDQNGWTDIYVANDANANQLWMNRGDGTFENTALFAGAAYNANGLAEAGMGVTAGDFDLDGDEDLFLTHLIGETNTLLLNDGKALFHDATDARGLGACSRPLTGFGVRWTDFDGDGLLDLFTANGAVKRESQLVGHPFPYGNPNLLLRNLGPPDFEFEDKTELAGPAIQAIETSRGAAFGDVDNDGDVDVLVSNANGSARLLVNRIGDKRRWLTLRLVGRESNRSAIGARLVLERDGAPDLVRTVRTDGSFCSANDSRLQFGFDDASAPQTVTVHWPGGRQERFSNLTVGRLNVVSEGAGDAPLLRNSSRETKTLP